MPISKRGEFVRNEIGLKAFAQYTNQLVEQAEIVVRSSQLSRTQCRRRFSFQWQNVLCADKKPVILVGFFPDEVKVWLWDKDIVAASTRGGVFLSGQVDATYKEFDQSPGHLIANIHYDDDDQWRRFGFETEFAETLARYQTKGERIYAKTPFTGLALGSQYKLFADIARRILDSFRGSKHLGHRVLPRCSKVSFHKNDKRFELQFKNILTDTADYTLLLPYYPDRVEAYLCKKKEIIHHVTESNHLLFNDSLDDQGLSKHIKLPGRLLASLPF